MKESDLSFNITDEIRIHVDLHRKHVVIACVTKDGKSIHLKATYKALDQIHEEIRKQLDG